MKKNKQTDEKKLVCMICQMDIHPKDNYVELIDYRFGDLFKRGYYHLTCWQQKLRNAITTSQQQMIGKTNELMDKLITRFT